MFSAFTLASVAAVVLIAAPDLILAQAGNVVRSHPLEAAWDNLILMFICNVVRQPMLSVCLSLTGYGSFACFRLYTMSIFG